MFAQLAKFSRAWLPPVLYPYAKSVGSIFKKTDPYQASHEPDFLKLNAGLPANVIRMRPDLTLAIHPESRTPYEAFCWRNQEMVEEMDSFLELTKSRQRLLDIGALHGVFSLAFAAQNPQRRVVSVDASPLATSKLLYNIHKNNMTGRVTPVECAMSDTPGTLKMYYEWEHAVAAPLSKDAIPVEVEKTTGDILCERLGFEPDLLKIDVEGHEVKVIRGLARTIHRFKPLLFIEIHPERIHQEKDQLTDLLTFLSQEGYRPISVIGAAGLNEISTAVTDVRAVFQAD